jgi:hypothetical protein
MLRIILTYLMKVKYLYTQGTGDIVDLPFGSQLNMAWLTLIICIELHSGLILRNQTV